VKFVTLKAYEKAGGSTRCDLFSESEDSVFILDAALLDRLVSEKLQHAEIPSKEGWKWVEAQALRRPRGCWPWAAPCGNIARSGRRAGATWANVA